MFLPVIKIDAARAKAKMRSIIESSPAARRAAVVEMSRLVVARVIATAPRDTNRYVRGWAEAANAAKIGRFSVPSLKAASRASFIEHRLREEVLWWDRIVQRYDRQGRRDKWYNQARRRLERAKIEYDRFHQAEGGAVIAIGTLSNIGSKKSPRALYKIYGGTGEVFESDGKTSVLLHNREPHASLVEKNKRIVSNAYSPFRAAGLQRARGAYLKKSLAAFEKAR